MASWMRAPVSTPAVPSPSIPRNTRRPTARSAIASATSSAEREFRPVDPARAAADDLLGQRIERAGHLAVRIGHCHRNADVAALPQLGYERDLAEHGNLELVGEILAAAGTEDLVAL